MKTADDCALVSTACVYGVYGGRYSLLPPLQLCQEDCGGTGPPLQEVSLRRPAPSSSEATPPKRRRKRPRITMEEARRGTEGVHVHYT